MEQEIGTYAVIKEGKLFQKPFLNFPQREVGEVNEEDRTLIYYENNFARFKTEVEELIAKINSEENKGSFLSYLENLRTHIGEMEAVGDVEPLYTQIHTLEIDINKQVRANRERNLAVKKGFIEELKALVHVSDTSLSADRVKDIRGKWIRVGAVDKEQQDALQTQFEQLITGFFSRYNEAMEEDAKLYTELVSESKELLALDDIGVARKRMVEIQKEWKLLPKIEKHLYVPLFNELKEVHDQFFTAASAKFQQHRKGKQKEDVQQNVEKKKQLIEEAAQLLKNAHSSSIQDLKKIQKAWKASGRVGKEEGDSLWEEFSKIGDEFFVHKSMQRSVVAKKDTPERDMLKAKIKWLRDAIKYEKKDLKTVEENMGAFRLNISSGKMKNLFQNQDKSMERRLEVKEKMIEQLQQKLTDLEKS